MIENLKIKQELNKLEVKEMMFLNKNVNDGNIKVKIHEIIPAGLEETLKSAFIKAFELVFNKGTEIIEKSFDKEKINLEYETSKFMLDYKESKENIEKIDKYPKKTNFINNLVTTSVGTGMGIIGMGIPDIPIFVATMLRGIYQISLSYGYEYSYDVEKVYILRIIRIALAKSAKEKKEYNDELKNKGTYQTSLEEEIRKTAEVMANALLIEKFIQGIPVVGAIGGLTNNSVYRKVSNFSMIKYKKRYLKDKINKTTKG
jgi:hypothetical protein